MGDEADAIVNRLSNPDPLAGVRARREPRCPTTELLVSQCGCRAHRGAPATKHATSTDPFESASASQLPDGPGPWFPARFGGECSGCGWALAWGEDIRADGNGGWEGRCCE